MEQIILVEGPKEVGGVETFERVRVYARPVGRPFVRGALLNVEWFIDLYPAPAPNPRSYFSYEKFTSLAEARAGRYGWFVRFALGETEDVW